MQLSVRDGSTLLDSRTVTLSRESQVTTVEFRVSPRFEGVKTPRRLGRPAPRGGSRRKQLPPGSTRSQGLEYPRPPRRGSPAVGIQVSPPGAFRRQVDSPGVPASDCHQQVLPTGYRGGIDPRIRVPHFPQRTLPVQGTRHRGRRVRLLHLPSDGDHPRLREPPGRGLLMLGGGSTLSAGGYQNTPIEEVLPVWLEKDGKRQSRRDRLPAGGLHGRTDRLRPQPSGSPDRPFRTGKCRTLEGHASADRPQPGFGIEAGGNAADAGRLIRRRRQISAAGLPPLWPGARPGISQREQLALADASGSRGQEPRNVLATGSSVAGQFGERPGFGRSRTPGLLPKRAGEDPGRNQ